MVLLYMVTWIPSTYPLYVSIYTSTMDPMGIVYGSLWMSFLLKPPFLGHFPLGLITGGYPKMVILFPTNAI